MSSELLKHQISELQSALASLQAQLDDVMTRDRFRLSQQCLKIKQAITQVLNEIKSQTDASNVNLDAQKENVVAIIENIEKLHDRFARSLQLREQRLASIPEINYPDDLPISNRRDEISEAINSHQVVILAGETGSGKTTQLPKICLELGRGVKGTIGHTQPRRIAARTVASRIAEELKCELGESVGYQVRFSDHSKDTTHIKLMTDGILLAEVQHDRFLSRYDTLIIDEAHERSLNIDFLLGYLKRLLPQRPDLKVIITSATIDVERFSKHFNNAPIIEVSGRSYPVTTHYRPVEDEYDDQYQAITEIVEEIIREETSDNRGGDILVFLSGEREIREAAKALREANFQHLDIVPLYARLSLAEQNKVFHAHRGRRVVLSTNVAETSLTVPGIRYVIDPGYARVSRYSYRSKIQRLPIEPISQASANQRQGRCGRVSAGVCYRLYSEQDFLSRPEFTDAEIRRTNLAAVILQMLNLRIGDIRDFPFVDMPDSRFVNDGFNLLQELQAVNEKNKLTSLGRQIMQMPVDPKLGSMVLAANKHRCLNEVLIIVSALSVQDPRDRPSDKKQSADEKHRRFNDDNSDFMAYLNLWNYAEEQRQELSTNQWRKQCQREFLSFLRLREWKDIHHQLLLAVKSLKLNINKDPANYEEIHRALLHGLLGHIAKKSENKEYLGARNRRLMIFPGSSQAKKSPKWMMSAQVLETSKVFAHQVAKVEPQWMLDAAPHLLKRQQFEPHYHVRSGQVKAFERISLHGLVLVEKSVVNFSQIDPVASRNIFIRSALVEGLYARSMKARRKEKSIGKFFLANEKLIKELHALEAKSRRKDILVDEEAIMQFFEQRIPADITNLSGFEHWRKLQEKKQPQVLFLTREDLMQHNASDVTQDQFPDKLSHDGLTFNLRYHFEPNHPADGVSLQVPVAALHLVPEQKLEWIIPGILREKCIALLKALPKKWRKNFVPVPSYVDKALLSMTGDNSSLTDALRLQLKRQTMVDVPKDIWDEVVIDDYYLMNIQVVDESGKIIEQSRDLQTLRDKYKEHLQESLQSDDNQFEREHLTTWDFGKLEDNVQFKRAGMSIKAYPALIDCGVDVSLTLRDNPIDAAHDSLKGITRLAFLSMTPIIKSLRKELLKGKDMALTMVDLGNREQVADDIIMAAIRQCCFTDLSSLTNNKDEDNTLRLPKTADELEVCLALGRNKVTLRAREISQTILEILASVVAIKKTIKNSKNALEIAITAGDIKKQLDALIYRGFIYETPEVWFQQYPRYLNAVLQRLDKAPSQIQKDKMWTQELHDLTERWQEKRKKEGVAWTTRNSNALDYRWMLEEYRVSLFAQNLKTRIPVSAQRLKKLWSECD